MIRARDTRESNPTASSTAAAFKPARRRSSFAIKSMVRLSAGAGSRAIPRSRRSVSKPPARRIASAARSIVSSSATGIPPFMRNPHAAGK
jgi:hypothetical protein